jgi:hypothetical protein
VIELLRGPVQELKIWQIVLLALWMLGCAVRRALDLVVNALDALLVHSVMAGKSIDAGDSGEEDGCDARAQYVGQSE